MAGSLLGSGCGLALFFVCCLLFWPFLDELGPSVVITLVCVGAFVGAGLAWLGWKDRSLQNRQDPPDLLRGAGGKPPEG